MTSSGGVQCWGDNTYGELGSRRFGSAMPVDVPGLTSGGLSVASFGSGYVCALLSSGAVRCWGGVYTYGKKTGTNELIVTSSSYPGEVTGL